MKLLGKMCLKIMLKVTKNQGFTLSLEGMLFEKPPGSFFEKTSRFRVKSLNQSIIL